MFGMIWLLVGLVALAVGIGMIPGVPFAVIVPFSIAYMVVAIPVVDGSRS